MKIRIDSTTEMPVSLVCTSTGWKRKERNEEQPTVEKMKKLDVLAHAAALSTANQVKPFKIISKPIVFIQTKVLVSETADKIFKIPHGK
jgi:hypothetical protein